MDVKLSMEPAGQLETECLAVAVLDSAAAGSQTSRPEVQSDDPAIRQATAELLASGEVTGRIFESVMVHRPQGLKAKRLLLIGGGKQKNFSSYELRKVAGTAVRFLKPKNIRSFAFAAPSGWRDQADPAAQSTYVYRRGGAQDAVRSIVEGAFVADFDPDTYKSDRKDQRM